MKLWDTLLLVGGTESSRSFMRTLFESDFNLLEATSLEQGLYLLEQNISCIAAVIVDRAPPETPEESFLWQASQRRLTEDIPMLALITPTGTGRLESLAFSLGASEVLVRHSPEPIIRRRVQVMVDLFRSRQELRSALEQQVETIRHTNESMVDALSTIIEYRSAESGSHTLRIRRFTEILLQEVARSCPEYDLDPDAIRNIASAAALHDIGKISIPDHILNKPGKLTEEEMATMREHTTNGSRMIEALSGTTSEDYLRYAYNICRSHHERWDGSGYPDGLKGDNIPICAQVASLADVFDALTNDRVYKDTIPANQAANMILNGECGSFSPKLLVCFKQVLQQFMELAGHYATGYSPKSDSISLPLPMPTVPDLEVSSLEMSQLKYQTLLHFTGATVIEMDLNRGTYHIVYNPAPNFRPLPDIFAPEAELNASLMNQVHPEDTAMVMHEYRFLLDEFFPRGLRKHSFSHRIYSPVLEDYRMYRVTFLRLDTGDLSQRKAIVVWQPENPLPVFLGEAGRDIVRENRALLALMGNAIRRRNDHWLTITDGQSSLVDLLGYSDTQITELFGDRFLELVLPEDREPLREHIQTALRSGNNVESEYRVRHSNGRILWILEKGCLITGVDGNEYFYGALIDNTRSHTIQEELTDTLQRYNLILNQLDNIVFDWDIERGRVLLPSGSKSALGYDVPDNTFRPEMLASSRIHPDDLDHLRALGAGIRRGDPSGSAELRIANSDNQYVWFRLQLTSMLDAQGKPQRAVGILANIDSTKRAYLALRKQALQDSLTGLLNKVATQSSIRDYVEQTDHPGCALLMIDLDNFKHINDNYGHLFGDTVITRIAQTFRRLFRNTDIIGRVGGDEFMVLLKDVPSEEPVAERCSALLNEVSQLFAGESQDCTVGCSIGVALSPQHGNTFAQLFQRADQALNHSKQRGKNCFSIYRESLDLAIQQFSSTPIDSNEQPGLANSSLVRAVFHQLSHSHDTDKTIQEVLALVGLRTNVSRVYIFENNDANTHCSNTFEWCNEGISPEIDNLQNISYETDIPGWEDNYDENGILFCPDIAQLNPEARAILEPQGVKSLLHCAIRENGVFRGYIGLDECESHRIWTQDQVDILIFLSEVVASFLLRKRSQDRTAAMTANLRSVLGTQHNWMYVVDPDTYELHYLNEKVQSNFPTLKVGDVCYKVIMGRDAPCPDCPIAKIDHTGHAKSRIVSPLLNREVISEAADIQWNGAPARLITCRDPD